MAQNDDLALRRAEYLAKAEEAIQLAAEATDQKVRESFAAMARTWRDLAAQAGRMLAEEPPS